jgi:hypothetical protein
MLWVPELSAAVVYVAVPPTSVTVASVVAPSLNVAVPVGLVPLTVAVRVTDWPLAEGLSDEVTLVVVNTIAEMVWLNAPDTLAPLFASPEYVAVMLWAPVVSVLIVKAADVPVIVAVPSVVAPSLNTTEPLGLLPVTVAVKVTG